MSLTVDATNDPRVALDRVGDYLRSRPVEHNVASTILHERVEHPVPGRYWWVSDDDEVVGYAFQSPPTFKAGVTPMARRFIGPLVDRMADEAPALPGVIGEAATAAAFAGDWTERFACGAQADEAERIYELREVAPGIPNPDGKPEIASAGDIDTIVAWLAAFSDELGDVAPPPPDLVDAASRRVEHGGFHVWRNSELVALAGTTPPLEGVVRVGPVYTPPEHRGHGYATALVAVVSAAALADGSASSVVLYTQLENPVSNRIYRRIGYRAVSEAMSYRFIDGRS